MNRLGKGGGQAELTRSQRTARDTEKFPLCSDFFPLPLSVFINLFLPCRAATFPQFWWLPMSITCLRQLCSFPKPLSRRLVAGGLSYNSLFQKDQCWSLSARLGPVSVGLTAASPVSDTERSKQGCPKCFSPLLALTSYHGTCCNYGDSKCLSHTTKKRTLQNPRRSQQLSDEILSHSSARDCLRAI